MPTMKAGPGRALLGGAGGYENLVMSSGPIALWMQEETAGTVARCSTNPAMNGTYTGVTLANDNTGPFGTPAPYYDGTNDYLNVLTAALQAAFNGSAGTAMIWLKVANAGVWTDGASRYLFHLYVDINNYVRMLKATANNTLEYIYKAGGANEYNAAAGQTSTGWMCMALTWSASAGVNGETRYYLSGASAGATDTALGVWAGNPTIVTIGAFNTTPGSVWHGWLGPLGLWDRALPQSEIAALYVT